MPTDVLGTAIELKLVSRIRERMKEWRASGWAGAMRTTLELLQYWQRDGRQYRLFFPQIEAAETIVFLTEARKGRGLPRPVGKILKEME